MSDFTGISPPPPRRVPCARCGYNIAGQRVGDPCPECGTTIGQYPVADDQSNGKAVASLVLGIISVLGCFVYGLPAVVCGPLAIWFEKKARLAVMAGEAPRSSLGTATAGRVLGIIGTSMGLIVVAIVLLQVLAALGVMSFSMWQAGRNAPAPLPTP